MGASRCWQCSGSFCYLYGCVHFMKISWAVHLRFMHFLYVRCSLQSLSRVWLFATPWTAAHQASLSIANSWSLLKLIHALEKEMATHSSVLAWRIPGTVEPGGLSSMGLHRVGHDWIDLAVAAACPLSQWCHPTISFSVVPFSSYLQSFPTSGSFQMSLFFASGGQSIGVSAKASILPMNDFL